MCVVEEMEGDGVGGESGKEAVLGIDSHANVFDPRESTTERGREYVMGRIV